MTREDFTERKVETLERLNCVAESLTSATMNHYDKSVSADVESIKGYLEQLENMIGNIEELQCYEESISD